MSDTVGRIVFAGCQDIDDAPEYRRLNAPSPSSESEHYKKGLEDGKPKWISVKDRLPEKQERYLVVFDCIEPEYSVGFSTFLLDVKEFNHTHITHWMPAPEPPKEDVKMTLPRSFEAMGEKG